MVSWLSLSGGKVVDDTGTQVYLRGLNTAGLEFGDGINGFTQAYINTFAASFSMNLWRLAINVAWWNNNVLMPDGVTHYQNWIQTVIGWMKAAGNYVEIDPVNYCAIPPANSGSYCDTLPSTAASDTFTRANQSGWGTSSSGQTWANTSGHTPTIAITSNEGVLSGMGGNLITMELGSTVLTDQGGQVRVAITNVTDVAGGVQLRTQGSTNWYWVYITPTALRVDKMVSGTETNIASVARTHTSGVYYWISAYIHGSTIYVQSWADGAITPADWDITVTDTSLASGKYGLLGYGAASGDTVKFDSYTVPIPFSSACIIAQNTQNFPPLTEVQQIAATVTFFQSFVPLYVNDPAILYNAMNEPNYYGITNTVADNKTVINAIRTIHPRSLIFVYIYGSVGIQAGTITNYTQPNLIFDYHVYDGSPTWQEQLGYWSTPSPIIASDTFTHSDQSGWPIASSGQTWATLNGSPTLSIASNEGVVTTGGTDAEMKLGSGIAADPSVRVRFAVSAAATNYAGAILRFTDSSNQYAFNVSTLSTLSIVKAVGGSNTVLATVAKAFTAGTFYWLRADAVGTTLSMRTWADGTTEPGTWDIQVTDTSLASGGYGLYANTSGSNTVKFDNFTVTTVPLPPYALYQQQHIGAGTAIGEWRVSGVPDAPGFANGVLVLVLGNFGVSTTYYHAGNLLDGSWNVNADGALVQGIYATIHSLTGSGDYMAAITITDAGRNLYRDGSSGANNPLITYVALGTSSVAPTASDTRLGAEVFRKAVTSYTNGATGEILINMYLAPGDTIGSNIQEVGFYGGSSANHLPDTGVLIAHGLYAHAKNNRDSIQFSLDLTVKAN